MMAAVRSLDDVGVFTGADGAHIREVVGRSTGLASHSIALITHGAGTASREHHHTVSDEVYFVQSGGGRIVIDGEVQALRAGDIITIRPGQRHKVYGDGPDLVLIVTCAPAYDVAEVVWDE